MRYFIRLSYNGALFCGWQIQNNARSIQEEVQNALQTILKEPITITGAGRTDTGVNAVNYIAHFDYNTPIDTLKRVAYKINAILPREIAIHEIFQVPDSAHARFDAISRTYKYYIHTVNDPFNTQFSYFLPPDRLNFEKMNIAAKHFLGEQDFSSLEKVNGGNKTSICNVTEAYWQPILEPSYLGNSNNNDLDINKLDFNNHTHFVFTVSANRFLRNMVRAMVGSLLEVGSGKREPEWIAQMLREKNRSAAGNSVPGNALFLHRIKYPHFGHL